MITESYYLEKYLDKIFDIINQYQYWHCQSADWHPSSKLEEIIRDQSCSLSFSLSAKQLCFQLPDNTARGWFRTQSTDGQNIRFVRLELGFR